MDTTKLVLGAPEIAALASGMSRVKIKESFEEMGAKVKETEDALQKILKEKAKIIKSLDDLDAAVTLIEKFNPPQEHINYYENVKVGIEAELNEVLAQETRLHNRVLAEKKAVSEVIEQFKGKFE